MLYNLKDKFVLDGKLLEVLYINQGCAWLGVPEDNNTFDGDRRGVAIVVIDEKGRDVLGNKVTAVLPEASMAI